jgi:hypothetical protein
VPTLGSSAWRAAPTRSRGWSARCKQVAALGQLNEHESSWLDEGPVGRSIVKLGINPAGMARVLIVHDAPASIG